MPDQLFYVMAPTSSRKQIIRTTEASMSHSTSATATQRVEESGGNAAVHHVFQQLTQSLTVLTGAAELVLEGKTAEPNAQAIRVWLQPNARQAEAAMHRLRDLRLTKSAAATELSQCLTVLVLAADMLVQGQLSGADALTFYGLLRRNADAAMKSLGELRSQFAPEAAPGA